MNLEEIINATVERRIRGIVERAIGEPIPSTQSTEYNDSDTREMSPCEAAVAGMIRRIALEEIPKHEDKIRAAIAKALSDSPASFEISAYTKIKVPKRTLTF